MKTVSLIFITIFTAFLLYSLYMVKESGLKMLDAIEQENANMGKSVVFNGDTSMLVGFDMWDESYTLSNGLTVHYKLVEFTDE